MVLRRQLFVFRFLPQTGNEPFLVNRKFQSSKPEVEKYPLGKPVGFCNQSPIFIFFYFSVVVAPKNQFCPQTFSKIPGASPGQNIKNKDSTLTIKFDFLFVEHNFDFRFFDLLPVSGRKRK